MSGYLLDTHVLLWAAAGTGRLSPRTLRILEDATTDVRFSVVSLWEMVVKLQLGRTDFQVDPRALRAEALLAGLREVAVHGTHVLAVADLPSLHRDPFDRLLVAQAQTERLTLLTVDPDVLNYGECVAQA